MWEGPICGILTLSQTSNFVSSKFKALADDIFKFDEKGRMFSKWVVNTVGKGKIAHCEQFLLFSQCFQKTYTADTLKPGLVWERVDITLVKLCKIFLNVFLSLFGQKKKLRKR